jgi:hypothetical protein
MDRFALTDTCTTPRGHSNHAAHGTSTGVPPLVHAEPAHVGSKPLTGDRGEIETVAGESALASEVPAQWRGIHVPFPLLYGIVKDARNEALHQGAFARHLTVHAIELSLVLEDAMRRSFENPVVGDFMVRNPVCAELWQPLSFVRQQMLTNLLLLPSRQGKPRSPDPRKGTKSR